MQKEIWLINYHICLVTCPLAFPEVILQNYMPIIHNQLVIAKQERLKTSILAMVVADWSNIFCVSKDQAATFISMSMPCSLLVSNHLLLFAICASEIYDEKKDDCVTVLKHFPLFVLLLSCWNINYNKNYWLIIRLPILIAIGVSVQKCL